MKTILFLVLVLCMGTAFARRTPSKVFLQGVGNAYLTSQLTADKKEDVKKGKFWVSGRDIQLVNDKTVLVIITLVDLRGPNKPLELPLPIPIDGIPAIKSIETMDIIAKEGEMLIKGYLEGECIFEMKIKKDPPKTPSSITMHKHKPRSSLEPRGFLI